MTTTQGTATPLDRFVGTLLDRDHPFWKDERQRAVYNEACAAAVVLQTLAVVLVGGIVMLIGGTRVVPAVTALVVAATCGQFLIMAILTRRNVELFPTGWRTQTSPLRKALSIGAAAFYVACYLFVSVRGGTFSRSNVAGMVGGVAFVLVAMIVTTRVTRRKANR